MMAGTRDFSTPAWDRYPVDLTTPRLLGEDREFYYDRLNDQSSRLFKDNQVHVEVITCTNLRDGEFFWKGNP